VPEQTQRILITGANGRLGQRLTHAIRNSGSSHEVRALVRSTRAARQIESLPATSQPHDLQVVDYNDAAALTQAAAGCEIAVHLVGIIRESENTTYTQAHEDTCAALTTAARNAGLKHIIYLSIFGADSESPNACLASKGRAEDLLLASAIRTTILRIPMVLGPGDPSTLGLMRQARARLVPLVSGGSTLQQPIDCRDVVTAVLAAIGQPRNDDQRLDLGGPECLSHSALIARTARALGRKPPAVFSIPMAPTRFIIHTLNRLLAQAPITLAMFEVLQHDDQIDPAPACRALDISLLTLDDTLRYCVSEESFSK
jgi:uncharacterized protein YbjT (DUF2867 family)